MIVFTAANLFSKLSTCVNSMVLSMPNIPWEKSKTMNSWYWLPCNRSLRKFKNPKLRKEDKVVSYTLKRTRKHKILHKTCSYAKWRLLSTEFTENWEKSLKFTFKSSKNPMKKLSKDIAKKSRNSLDNLAHPNP